MKLPLTNFFVVQTRYRGGSSWYDEAICPDVETAEKFAESLRAHRPAADHPTIRIVLSMWEIVR